MTGDAETRDLLLGDLLRQIPVPRLSPAAAERLSRARSETRRSITPRRRRALLVFSTATLAGAIALAVFLALPRSTPVDRRGGVTDVRTLTVFGRVIDAHRSVSLPPDFADQVSYLSAKLGERPVISEALVGPPSIYLATFDPGELCIYFAAPRGGAWSCGIQTLQQADGSLYIKQAFILGQSYVWGLAANNVQSITVSAAINPTAPATTDQAQLANNAFVATVPGHLGLGIGVVKLTVTRTDGSTTTVTPLGGR